ncbi:MAG TPA: alpha/beta hydrolase [Aquabacterium sp.]|uniref:alpha/beta fold hydrolase n=1 Tax=Aquabacterium sp. TaxID=1872578 RepID=UPI002E36774E|nr:alpha/beta hydrolase [Aquabacterium sp.]HEX5356033.1 alpha/beta hydrolase [Aquabacterium sp.]
MKALKIAGGVLALVVALAGVGVVTAWAPDRAPETLTARWAQAPSQFVAVDGMQVHLRDEGPRDDPQPIVLLHGTSASLHTWDGWVAALKGQHRVIRVDMPGFGLTGPTPDGQYTLPVYTHFVVAVMDKLGVKQAVIAGNSFGGNIAWKTAVDYPDRVSKLVLVDAAGYSYQSKSIPLAFKLAQIPALRPIMGKLLPRRMIESSVRNVYGDPSKITPELIDRYYELTLRAGNRDALVQRFLQSKSGEFEDQIKTITKPTLIIWGGQDNLIPPDNADKFQRDIQGSRLAVFDALGHVPHEEDPASTVAAVQAFLDQH